MAFDLTSIDPSEWLSFRKKWVSDSGLDSVGSDRLFDTISLAELIDLSDIEIKQYAKQIGLKSSERKKLRRGVTQLKGLEYDPTTPITPSFPSMPSLTLRNRSSSTRSRSGSTRSRSNSKSLKKSKKHKRNKSKSSSSSSSVARVHTKKHKKSVSSIHHKKSKKKSKSRKQSLSTILPSPKIPQSPISSSLTNNATSSNSLYDNLESAGFKVEKPTAIKISDDDDILFESNMESTIKSAIYNLDIDGESTKQQIREVFYHFKQKITERELKLIRDVESTVFKKKRMLQSQLEYIQTNGCDDSGMKELSVDTDIGLEIQKAEILRCIITAGWIQGAVSDNREEEEEYKLEQQRRELSRQQFLTVEKLKQVTIFEKECALSREDSIRLQSEVRCDIRKIKERTILCESELSIAKPLLEEAEKLVSTINKKQLNEIRTLKKPPMVLELVMSAVAVVLGNNIKSWKDVQKTLSDHKFVQKILNFDTNNLEKKTRKLVEIYSKHDDFNEERANKASRIAGPLVKWVKSQVRYSELLDIVRPMKKEIKLLKKTLSKKQKLSKKCIQNVQELEFNISKCRTDINEMVENMIKLQEKFNIKDDVPTAFKVVKHQIQHSMNTMYLTSK